MRYANATGRGGELDTRHLLNGLIDSYLYYSGRVDTTLPFDDYGGTLINETAQAADGAPDFSQRIRVSLLTTLADPSHRPFGSAWIIVVSQRVVT